MAPGRVRPAKCSLPGLGPDGDPTLSHVPLRAPARWGRNREDQLAVSGTPRFGLARFASLGLARFSVLAGGARFRLSQGAGRRLVGLFGDLGGRVGTVTVAEGLILPD